MIVIKNKKLRDFLKIAIPFFVIPAVVLCSANAFESQRYLIISLTVAVLSLLLFISGFERKQVGSRRMVLVAVMTAFCVVGRFIPLFKPITAITAISAVYLGGESGFLIGAISALVSNCYFGQGPWTPFQMLAWGLIGLFAGILSEPLKKSRLLLTVYGLISGIFYSLVMDVWTVLWYNQGFSLTLYKLAVITALPFIAMYSVSNVLFLWIIAKPFGQKLERVKRKYGI